MLIVLDDKTRGVNTVSCYVYDRMPYASAVVLLITPLASITLLSIEESRQVVAPHSHQRDQWLIDFQPLGYTFSLETGPGYQTKLGLSHMLSKHIALGGNLEYQRTGFSVGESSPPSYHHLRAKRLHAFASLIPALT